MCRNGDFYVASESCVSLERPYTDELSVDQQYAMRRLLQNVLDLN